MANHYFATTDYTISAATQTLTHGLSHTPGQLRVRLTAKTIDGATDGAAVVTIGTNLVLLRTGSLNGLLFDVEVQRVHSIVGGPNG